MNAITTNGNGHVKIKFEWIFRVLYLVATLAITCGVFWIREDINRQLAGYVSKREFETYKEAQARLNEQVINNLRDALLTLTRRVESIDSKLDRVIERKQ